MSLVGNHGFCLIRGEEAISKLPDNCKGWVTRWQMPFDYRPYASIPKSLGSFSTRWMWGFDAFLVIRDDRYHWSWLNVVRIGWTRSGGGSILRLWEVWGLMRFQKIWKPNHWVVVWSNCLPALNHWFAVRFGHPSVMSSALPCWTGTFRRGDVLIHFQIVQQDGISTRRRKIEQVAPIDAKLWAHGAIRGFSRTYRLLPWLDHPVARIEFSPSPTFQNPFLRCNFVPPLLTEANFTL